MSLFVDIPKAAELAAYSVRHMRRIIDRGDVKAFFIRRKQFVNRQELEHWIRNHKKSN